MNERINKAIAEKIKEMRQARKLTQEQLANLLDIGRTCYANYEQNIRELSIEQLIRICDICGYDVNEVITDLRKSVYRK